VVRKGFGNSEIKRWVVVGPYSEASSTLTFEEAKMTSSMKMMAFKAWYGESVVHVSSSTFGLFLLVVNVSRIKERDDEEIEINCSLNVGSASRDRNNYQFICW
jgi:hypothetical protein